MLQGHRCAQCKSLWLEAARPCPSCGAPGGEIVELTGNGRLVSWTTIRVPPARYATEAPYVVGVVALDEGLRVTARLTADPDTLSRGLAVTLASVDPARGPVFRPA